MKEKNYQNYFTNDLKQNENFCVLFVLLHISDVAIRTLIRVNLDFNFLIFLNFQVAIPNYLALVISVIRPMREITEILVYLIGNNHTSPERQVSFFVFFC